MNKKLICMLGCALSLTMLTTACSKAPEQPATTVVESTPQQQEQPKKAEHALEIAESGFYTKKDSTGSDYFCHYGFILKSLDGAYNRPEVRVTAYSESGSVLANEAALISYIGSAPVAYGGFVTCVEKPAKVEFTITSEGEKTKDSGLKFETSAELRKAEFMTKVTGTVKVPENYPNEMLALTAVLRDSSGKLLYCNMPHFIDNPVKGQVNPFDIALVEDSADIASVEVIPMQAAL